MFSIPISFPSSGCKDNFATAGGGKRARRHAPTVETNSSSRPSPQKVAPKPSSVRRLNPRTIITLLANPETAAKWLPPTARSSNAPSTCQSAPRITILSNPARTRSLPSIQGTHSSSARQSPPRITILTNPARERSPPSPHNSQNAQDGSAAAPAPKRAPTPAPISKTSAPAKVHPLAAARAALKRAHPNLNIRIAGPYPDLPPAIEPSVPADAVNDEPKTPWFHPRIVVHAPVWWDLKPDVHHPATGDEGRLGVPAINSRGKLQEHEFARYYPKEHAAEQAVRRLRSKGRNGSRLAFARRRERARQCKVPSPTVAPPTAGGSRTPGRSFFTRTSTTHTLA
ncbi:hypothetical protein F5148DRAFT_135417 [Russula earlei]|uniref:Uncharacterized protein n=1 Tax=Russula earlei TaxID=71964 RepID=A0ACC0U6N1_9AGAM|nr:hypothetical protein F5148DRAFT_135417 [Russula earlei]